MINDFHGSYRFLSNFYLQSIEYEGLIYFSSEAAYQAAKTLDNKERLTISLLPTPGEAKRMGRRITLRSDWEQVKDQIMYDICKIKFENPDLKRLLLGTGNQELIEGNTWHDQVWGKCYCAKCKGNGENRLGKVLMKSEKNYNNEHR